MEAKFVVFSVLGASVILIIIVLISSSIRKLNSNECKSNY